MLPIAIAIPPLILIHASVAAVWLYEGLWCKLLGQTPSQLAVVTAVPRFGQRYGALFLRTLGATETALGLWALSGFSPAFCAVVQTCLLIILNLNGLIWARHLIHDPVGMIFKNAAFLVLAWIGGALPSIAGNPR